MKSCRILLRVLVSFLVLQVTSLPLDGCGYYDPESGRVWYYLPTISNLPSLFPYTYSYDKFSSYGLTVDHYGYDHTSSYAARQHFWEINVEQWKSYLGNQVKKEDIYNLLYNTDPDIYFEQPQQLAGNSFWNAISSNENPEVRKYFDFAKHCESFLASENSWNNRFYANKEDLLTAGLSLVKTVKDPWIQERLAFLNLKLCQYINTETAKAYGESLFNTYFKDKAIDPGNWILPAATYQYALIQDDPVARNYWLSKAFDGPSYNRFMINLKFNETLKTETLRQTKNKREKAFVELICELDNPGRALENLKYIYRLTPDLNELKLLVAREINKLEDWLYSDRILEDSYNPLRENYFYKQKHPEEAGIYDAENGETGEFAQSIADDYIYLKEVRNFVEQVLEDKKQKDQAFWTLSAAYLAFLNADFTKARIYLDELKQFNDLPANIQLQYKTTEALTSIFNKEEVSDAALFNIYELYQVLEKEQEGRELLDFKSHISLLLADCLIRNGDKARGVLLLSRTDKMWGSFPGSYMAKNLYHKMLDIFDPEDYDATLKIIQNPDNIFDQWLTAEPYPYQRQDWFSYDYSEEEDEASQEVEKKNWSVDRILDYKATTYVREDQLELALEVLQQIDSSYLHHEVFDYYLLSSNPFGTGLLLRGVSEMWPDSNLHLTKPAFLEKLLAYKKDALDKKDQKSAVLTANAYFNMTYHGEWWLMQNPAHSTNDSYTDESTARFTSEPTEEGEKGYGWMILLLGILILLGTGMSSIQHSGTFAKASIAIFTILIISQISACNLFQKEVPAPVVTEAPVDPRRAAFEKVYYGAERALQWYQKAYEMDPNTELAAFSGFMIEKIKEFRWKVNSKSHDDETYEYIPLPKQEHLKHPNPGVTSHYSCQGFNTYLQETGWTFE